MDSRVVIPDTRIFPDTLPGRWECLPSMLAASTRRGWTARGVLTEGLAMKRRKGKVK